MFATLAGDCDGQRFHAGGCQLGNLVACALLCRNGWNWCFCDFKEADQTFLAVIVLIEIAVEINYRSYGDPSVLQGGHSTLPS